MNQKFVDLELLENDDVNPIDMIMGYVERSSLLGYMEVSNKEDLETSMLQIERMLQDLSDIKSPESSLIVSKAYESLQTILPLIREEDRKSVV